MVLLEQFWSWIVVAVLVYVGGVVSKMVAAKKGWRAPADAKDTEKTWYDATLPAHPLLAGALLGLFPWPTLHVINEMAGGAGPQLVARVGWFCLAGAFCGKVYETIDNIVDGLDDLVLDAIRKHLRVDVPPSRPPSRVPPRPSSDAGGEA